MADINDQPASKTSIPNLLTARFTDPARMQEAVSQLGMAGFDRADMSLPETHGGSTPETGARAVDTEEDARQVRTAQTSTGAAIAAMAAAGVTIATGGAAAPAIAAAVAAGGLAGGGIFALSSAANSGEQSTRDQDAAMGNLLLTVRTPTQATYDKAQTILRAAGGELTTV